MSEGGGFLLPTIPNRGIQTLDFDACISRGKLPVNGGHLLIAIVLPALHLLTELIHRRDVVFQPLPRQYREFNLRNIEPTGMFGGIVDLQSIQQPFGLVGRKGLCWLLRTSVHKIGGLLQFDLFPLSLPSRRERCTCSENREQANQCSANSDANTSATKQR